MAIEGALKVRRFFLNKEILLWLKLKCFKNHIFVNTTAVNSTVSSVNYFFLFTSQSCL